MADALRKNIYISQEDVKFFRECEEHAQNNDMAMSNMIIKSLKKYMQTIDSSLITLVIKRNEVNNELCEYKKIQFKGKKITETELIVNDSETPKCVCIIPKISMNEDHQLTHKYTFYKTCKDKLLVYINKIHLQIEYDYNGFEINNEVIEEECEYRVFNDIREIVKVFNDVPNKYIDKLIMEVAKTEFLDI
ncbi:hypothetical protein [Clostridium massiliodielmoense]|uniref:hypothetical protein n=1 Tax=Clostridium massiliodielmoense TaxID=1776385 RepID=UPI000A271956|nr:hypothetical protein [Clostridium massiliodielmoense]